MFAPLNPDQRRVILTHIANSPTGSSVEELSRLFDPAPDERRLKFWLQGLLQEDLIKRVGYSAGARYQATDVDALRASLAPPSAAKPAAGTPAPSAGPTTAAHAESDDYPSMFDFALPMIVGCRMRRASAVVVLREQSLRNQLTGPAMAAYVTYATGQLDKLTLADVEPFGLSAAEFSAWHAAYHVAEPGPGTPKPAGNLPLPPAPTVSFSSSNAPATPAAATVAPTAGAPTPPASVPTPAAPSPVSPATPTSPLPATAPDLLRSLENVRVDHIITRAVELTKSLLTPMRIATALVWALALRLFCYHPIFWGRFTFLLLLVLCGLPWLFFRCRDQIAAKARLNAKEALLVLFAGGYLSLFAAGLLLSLLTSLRHGIS